MTEEHKIKAALKVEASQIQLPPDLLDRISRRADTVTPVRPSLWARWRLGPRLELAAACILLVGLVGMAAYRNLNSDRAPMAGEQGSSTLGTASNAELAGLVPKANEVTTARVTGFDLTGTYLPLQSGNPADLAIITKVLRWLENGQVVSRFSQDDAAKGDVLDLPRNRSNVFRFELRDGGSASVRLAYECTSSESGSGTTCHTLAGEVIFIPAGSELPFRVKQPELAKWLSDGWQQDLKLVQSQGNVPRTGGFPCGAEVINAEHQGYNADARDCLWQSFQGGKYAEFTTTAPTEEGDLITYRVRVVTSNHIEVELDTTKDRLGDQKITKWTCTTMEMISPPSGKIAGAIKRRSFAFRGCTGGDSSEVHIPW